MDIHFFKDLDIFQQMTDTISKHTPNDLDLLFQGKKNETLVSWNQ